MSSQYTYTNYQQYSPNLPNSSLLTNTSPTANISYLSPPGSSNNSLSSSVSSISQPSTTNSMLSSSSSNYSFHTPRLRYYLSKSFDMEDDLEFCPDIPDSFHTSPSLKKFNPYTATTFSPSQDQTSPKSTHSATVSVGSNTSPRVHTPRIRKPLEIINPQTKMRIDSPAIQNK